MNAVSVTASYFSGSKQLRRFAEFVHRSSRCVRFDDRFFHQVILSHSIGTKSTVPSTVESGLAVTANASHLSANATAPLPARTAGIVFGTVFAAIAFIIVALGILRVRRNRKLRYREGEGFKVQHPDPSSKEDIFKCSDNKSPSDFVTEDVRTSTSHPDSSTSPTSESPDDEVASLEVLPPKPLNFEISRRS